MTRGRPQKSECINGHSLSDAYVVTRWVWAKVGYRRVRGRNCRPCQKARSQKQRDKAKVTV